jgi:hypothetical protein
MTRKNTFKIFRNRDERGQNLLEFALVAPILIFLFMGMVDFGWVLHQQIQLDNATREGARRGAVGETCEEIIDTMMASTDMGLSVDDITIEVRLPGGGVCDDNSDRTPENKIAVMVKMIDIPMLTPVGNFISGFSPLDLTSESEFLIE